MSAVQCPTCESDDIDVTGKSLSGDLNLKCDDCSTEWTRTPNRPCPKCSAIDVTHTDVAGYLCRVCAHSWRDIPVTLTPPAPVKATRARAASSATKASTSTVRSGLAHRIDAVWALLETHVGENFTLKSGQPFSYQISNDVLMPTTANWDAPKAEFAEALRRMPVSGAAALRDLKAASFIFALLHDDRVTPGWR